MEIRLKDGRVVERWADEAYRGGPDNPLSDAELEAKFADNAAGLLDAAAQRALLDCVWSLETAGDASRLLDLSHWGAFAGVTP